MSLPRARLIPVLLAVTAALGTWGTCGGAAARAAPAAGIHNLQHVVMITQENRSFDQYFGTYPGANGIPAGVCMPDPVNGGCQAPFHNSADQHLERPPGDPPFARR